MSNFICAQRSAVKWRLAGLGIFFFGVMNLLIIGQAHAAPLIFEFGFGGTVSYGGSHHPLVTTNGIVTHVTNGTIRLPITDGDLDFSTGNYDGGSATAIGFRNVYLGGGSLTIAGTIGPGEPTLLLSGDFSGSSIFDCCASSTSSFSGLLNISHVDSALASALDFNLPATGGSIAQVQIFFGSSAPATAGAAFSGIQGGGGLTVAPVPVPAAVYLFGSGLIGLAGLVRRKLTA